MIDIQQAALGRFESSRLPAPEASCSSRIVSAMNGRIWPA